MNQLPSSGAQPDYVALASEIVSAFVSHNSVPPGDLPSLIGSVHSALRNVGQPVQKEPEKPIPAIPIKKTITPDHLISLEDGRPYKSLKRHLSSRGLTPDQYRQKWGLAADYPMVAANYAKTRSELARAIGLGQLRRTGARKAPSPQKASPAASKKSGRKKPA